MKKSGFAISTGAALAFCALVWPTLYRYDHINERGIVLPVRINRLSGAADIMYPSGWRRVQGPEAAPSAELSSEELSRLTGNASITSYGAIDANIYNGTQKTVREIIVQVTVSKASGATEFTRTYALYTTTGSPLSASEYTANAGFTLSPDQKWSWSIVGAK